MIDQVSGFAMPPQQSYNEPRPLNLGEVSPTLPNVIRRIEIEPLSYGYVVKVGCQTFAIENASALIAKLSEYITSPAATEKKWNEGKLF